MGAGQERIGFQSIAFVEKKDCEPKRKHKKNSEDDSHGYGLACGSASWVPGVNSAICAFNSWRIF